MCMSVHNETHLLLALLLFVLFLVLLLLAAMKYKQVKSFWINDYANHYVNIEITGCRVLYSKSIAGRGVVGWAKQGQLAALINQVFDCYIKVN